MPTFCPDRRALLRGMAGIAAGAVLFAWERPAAAADTEAAARLIAELAERTIAVVSDDSLSRKDRAARLRAIIDRGFDTKSIGRFVLGKHWQNADEAERREFVALFREYTAMTYARRFEAYASQRLAVSGARPAGNGDNEKVRVLSEMRGAEGAPVKIEWRLRHGADGWRIYDVIVEGVSMVLTQRSEFAAVIDRNGGKLQPLLDRLKDRVASLA
jgi:phospholipid transport system substrate-binding protein